MKITSLGYKPILWRGDKAKIFYYKLVDDNKEFLIVHMPFFSNIEFEIMHWASTNSFVDAQLTAKKEKQIISAVKNTKKKNTVLALDKGEEAFFTKFDAPVKKTQTKKKTKPNYLGNEVERLLSSIFDMCDNHPKTITITEQKIRSFDFDNEVIELLLPLVGYKVKFGLDAEPQNDFALVDASFIFTSPKQKKTTIEAQFSLMNGFSFSENKLSIQ